MGVGDEDRLQFMREEGIVRKTFPSKFLGMKPGIEKKRKTVNLQEIGVCPDFLPAAENREGPGHNASRKKYLW